MSPGSLRNVVAGCGDRIFGIVIEKISERRSERLPSELEPSPEFLEPAEKDRWYSSTPESDPTSTGGGFAVG